jgi:diguanylate cyclase
MIITMWMFSISGLSFIYGIVCGQIFYLFVYLTLLIDEKTSNVDFVTCIYYMLVSYFMGAVIAYHKDVQSRKIFLAHQALELEKQHHQHKSIHDPLTKLPNRELLEDRLAQAINYSSRAGVVCAGLFIDLDNFKSINDEYGHLMGDLYLKQVANHLKDITRDADTIARISGDEFFILMQDIKNEEAALILAQKIQQSLHNELILNEQFKLKGRGASVGICMFPYANCTPQDIINRADQSMYQVKVLTKNLSKNNTATA